MEHTVQSKQPENVDDRQLVALARRLDQATVSNVKVKDSETPLLTSCMTKAKMPIREQTGTGQFCLC